jgi:hypothetical protein
MTTQTQSLESSQPVATAESALYRFEARITEALPVGIVPGGIRVDFHFDGRVTEGALEGARVRGIDYLVFRPDGVGVIDARKLISHGESHVATRAHGFVVPPEGFALPAPEEMLSADYVWPDTPFAIRGFELIETGAPALEHLNRTVAAIEGSVNNRTGRLVIEGRVVAPFAA